MRATQESVFCDLKPEPQDTYGSVNSYGALLHAYANHGAVFPVRVGALLGTDNLCRHDDLPVSFGATPVARVMVVVVIKTRLLVVVNPGADHRRGREVRDARQNQAIVGS